MIKGKPCTICKQPDDYSDETICHNCINKWRRILKRKERIRVLKKLKKVMKTRFNMKDKYIQELLELLS